MPFKKGETGNPGGRPKAEQDVLAIARAAGPKAIEKLITLIDHEDARIAATASEQVLNRGFGKPHQSVSHSGETGGPVIFKVIYET